MVKLLSEKNKVIAESILTLLKNNGIEGYIKKPEYGGYSHSISNHSIFGYDIYINEEDLEQAQAVIEYLQAPVEEGEVTEEDVEFEQAVQEMKERRKRWGQWCGVVLLLVMVGVLIIQQM